MKAPATPPREHPGQRAFLESRCHQLRPRKPVQGAVGAVEARKDRGTHQQPEAAQADRQRAQRGRQCSDDQADLKRALASDPRLQPRHRHGRKCSTHHIARDRQRGHPSQGRKRQTDEAVDGDEGHVVGQEQRLAQGQQQQLRGHEPQFLIARNQSRDTVLHRGAARVPHARSAAHDAGALRSVCKARGLQRIASAVRDDTAEALHENKAVFGVLIQRSCGAE